MRAGLSCYRALPQDAADNRVTAVRFKLPLPVLAVGGDRGRGAEPAESLRRVATDVRGEIVSDSGHWIAEAQPAHLARLLRESFAPDAG